MLQLKTEAKRKEDELAGLEKQDVSLSAQIEESKKGKENSVSSQLPANCLQALCEIADTREQQSLASLHFMASSLVRKKDTGAPDVPMQHFLLQGMQACAM